MKSPILKFIHMSYSNWCFGRVFGRIFKSIESPPWVLGFSATGRLAGGEDISAQVHKSQTEEESEQGWAGPRRPLTRTSSFVSPLRIHSKMKVKVKAGMQYCSETEQ